MDAQKERYDKSGDTNDPAKYIGYSNNKLESQNGTWIINDKSNCLESERSRFNQSHFRSFSLHPLEIFSFFKLEIVISGFMLSIYDSENVNQQISESIFRCTI